MRQLRPAELHGEPNNGKQASQAMLNRSLVALDLGLGDLPVRAPSRLATWPARNRACPVTNENSPKKKQEKKEKEVAGQPIIVF